MTGFSPTTYTSSLRATAVLLVVFSLGLAGCGSISTDGVDGFTPLSEVWTVESVGTTRSHSLVLTSVSDYCSKRRKAEQDRLDADRRNAERLAAGEAVCESTDLWYDDMAAAYSSLARSGARYLQVQLDREGVENIDSRTAPGPGTFAQFGSTNDGSYTGQLRYFADAYWQRSADAYSCSDPDTVDESQWIEFLNEDEGDLREIWNLSGGSVELAEDSADRWAVTVDADLMTEAQATVGSLTANFSASRCEIEVGESVF
ncbi:MAG: hypothetical protein CMP23_00410 [Rickettsiales bacterium]|nr:hypothetical protein [Rickettsiales bacterium]|tara:strand:+ start:75 stop:851 length:777 start_codon:yes stop_codon:yes gene_type:complete